MLRLLAWLVALALLAVTAVAALLFQAVGSTPLVPPPDELTAANLSRLKGILRANDPRRLRPDTTREVAIAGADLQALLDFAARGGLPGRAAVALHETGADLRYTWPLPAPLPAGRYLNARAALAADGQIESLRLGEIRLPGGLIMLALDAGLRHSTVAAEFALLKRTVSQVRLAPDALRVTYTWQPELLASARALALTPAEQNGLAAAHQRLVEVMNRVGAGRRSADLGEVLVPLLQEAGAGAATGQRAAAYRYALFVTAAQLSGKNVALLVPAIQRRPRPLTLTLHGRHDLAQHFTISAALAAWAGEPLANTIGLDKEVDDARGGSGFSFADLAADRAGTRFGELAVHRPTHLANILSGGVDALMPPIDGLPEHLMSDEFARRFGTVGSPAYQGVVAEIERRIAALALFQSP